MLYLDSATTTHGVTLFRDYNASNRYFFLPLYPKLTREAGDPLFQLLIYRRDITDNPAFKEGDRLGGGFLTMTVDLSVPESTLNAIKEELSKQAGQEIELTPVPYDAGSVRITALGATSGTAADASKLTTGARFVENILGSTKPSLYGDNRAVFSMELSQEGALLMKASLEDPGATQIAVVYDLDYKGLMPAYRAKIKIHFQQSYSYLRSHFTMNTLYFKADLDADMEKLTKDGSIKIEEVDFTGMDATAAAASREKLNTLAKELATWAFFHPSLNPGSVLTVDRGQLVAADPTQAASAVASGFSQPIQAIATSKGDAAGTSGPRLQGQSGADENARAAGRPLPTGDSTPAAGDSASPEARPLTAVERWNQAGRPQAAFLMKSLSQEEQQDLEYDLFQVSATKRSAAPQGQIRMAAGDAQLAGRIKEVDLDSPFFQRISGTVATNVDLNALGVTSMVVKLRYGVRDDGTTPKDTAEFVFTEKGQKGNYSFMLDRKFTMDLEYQIVVKYEPGFAIGDPSLEAVSPWIKTTTRNLDVDPAEVEAVFAIDLAVAQVDWNAVSSIECTLNYDDASPQAIRQATAVLTQQKSQGKFHIRPLNPQNRAYKLTATYQFKTGQTSVVELKGVGAKTFVLNQPTQLAVPITVIASDPLKHFSKMAAELSYKPADSDTEQTKLLTFSSNGETQTWTVFRASAAEKPAYQYRLTMFATNGSERRTDWQSSSDQLLVVGEVFQSVLQVSVRMLVPDFKAAGLLGAKLHLQYGDAAEGIAGNKDMVFMTPNLEPTAWAVPKKPGGSGNYDYTITWIGSDGKQRVVGPRSTADEELLLHPAL
jgi:hypothetical protein